MRLDLAAGKRSTEPSTCVQHPDPVLIRSFGLFWRRDEVEWTPGRGARFEMLGRVGSRYPGLRVADFRDQRGLYVLYNDYGPYYVGLARERGIGLRLKDHTSDYHGRRWDRFSWFGFKRVLKQADGRGLRPLAALRTMQAGSTNSVIADMEALLIKALGCEQNLNKMNFPKGDQWTQIKLDDRDGYLSRIQR